MADAKHRFDQYTFGDPRTRYPVIRPLVTVPEFGSSESPLGRAAQPAEFASAYVFLASAESSFAAGEALNVNGGTVTP